MITPDLYQKWKKRPFRTSWLSLGLIILIIIFI